MILKPAETTSLTALEFGAIAESVDLPKGVLNILSDKGSVVGLVAAAFTISEPLLCDRAASPGRQFRPAAR